MNREMTFRDFFRDYAVTSLGPEPEQLAGFYDTSFLVAGPKGGAAFSNDPVFLAWLREVHAFNVKSGMTAMTVGTIDEQHVSADYSLVTVAWLATFIRTGVVPIEFRISYLLHQTKNAWKIAGYISHEDQEAVMRARGL